jgi:hypothetical protein
VFPTKVRVVEERRLAKRAYKDAKGDAVIEYETIGFFLVLEMLRTAIRISDEDPGIAAGAEARLIIEVDE